MSEERSLPRAESVSLDRSIEMTSLRDQSSARAILEERRRVRVRGMLNTLEVQLVTARAHCERMGDAFEESVGWQNADDRAWARAAHAEAVVMLDEAERRLEAGRRIVAELEVAR